MKNLEVRNYLQKLFENANSDEKKIIKNIYNKFAADYEINFAYTPSEVLLYKENGFFPTLKNFQVFSNGKNVTNGVFLNGENYFAIDLLRASNVKVDVIYIDPPYNTNNDNLNYTDSFKHSEWMTDISERLIRSKDLLAEDGFIAVSIDDNELISLCALLNSIYGRENKVGIFPRKSKTNDGGAKNAAITNDWVVIYTKNIDTKLAQFTFSNPDDYIFEDEFVDERGKYYSKHTLDSNSLGYQPQLDYMIEIGGKKFVPGGSIKSWEERQKGNYDKFDPRWTWNRERFEIGVKLGLVQVKGDRLYIKKYENVKFSDKAPHKNMLIPYEKQRIISSLEFVDSKYTNESASKELKKFFGDKKLKFDYPKPTSLISKIISLSPKDDAVVLDFYAGTGTTAHAVALLNDIADKKQNRKFIVVTNDESNVDAVILKRLKMLEDTSFIYAEVSKTTIPGYVDDSKDLLVKTTECLLEIKKRIEQESKLDWRKVFENGII